MQASRWKDGCNLSVTELSVMFTSCYERKLTSYILTCISGNEKWTDLSADQRQ
jgi:hypothetical protein